MSYFTKEFQIQQQIHPNACIAASACSLIDALGVEAPTQATLDPLVHQGMSTSKNGFDSLADALKQLGLAVVASRCTPSSKQLVQWFQDQSKDHQGFLISHHVCGSGAGPAHITVVFHDCKGSWSQADPGTASTTLISLSQLVANYAGDVAVIR